MKPSGLVAALALALVLASAAAAGPPPSLTGQARAFVLSRLGVPTGQEQARVGDRAGACTPGSGILCSVVDVPLDRTGVVPGTIPLQVEVLPAQGTPRGAMFLIAGGPGQGSAHSFDLSSPIEVGLYRLMFPGYTLVAYDDRGTGGSGLLDCPALQAVVSSDSDSRLVADCAALLGPQRDFYSTGDHVEDLDAVRQSLGLDKVGLYGTSYGTKLAIAYALAHPDHVERLLLDSVLPPELPDPLATNVLSALPGTLGAFCAAGRCRAATPDFAGDVTAVANALAAKPLQGKVLLPGGGSKAVALSGVDFLGMIVDADLNPGLAAELPAAVHAARLGSPQALLRTFYLDSLASAEAAPDLSFALLAATDCHDGPFPWAPDSATADRPAALQAAIAALPAGSFGPFGSWAAALGNASLCVGWPSPSGGVTLGAGPLPDVPVLAISGGFDMRTPTAGAFSVAARFPQGHVLVVPGVGHSVLGVDISGCSQQAVHTWMVGGQVPARCARPPALVADVPAYPAPLKRPATPAQTLAIATKTYREAQALWLMTSGLTGRSATVSGLYGGKLVSTARTFRFAGYSIEPGIALTGTLELRQFGPPLVFQGTATVGGPLAARGALRVLGSNLRGTLGGR